MLFWLLFSFNYCVTALLIRSCLLSRFVTPDKTWTIVLFLVLIFTLGTLLLCFLLHSNSAMHVDFIDLYSTSWLSALNPFVLSENMSDFQAGAAIIWTAILAPLLLLWFVLRVRHFSPFDRSDTMTLEQAAEAVRRADADPLVKGKHEKTVSEATS